MRLILFSLLISLVYSTHISVTKSIDTANVTVVNGAGIANPTLWQIQPPPYDCSKSLDSYYGIINETFPPFAYLNAGGTFTSQYLSIRNWGFDLPTDAVNVSFSMSIIKSAEQTNTVQDDAVIINTPRITVTMRSSLDVYVFPNLVYQTIPTTFQYPYSRNGTWANTVFYYEDLSSPSFGIDYSIKNFQRGGSPSRLFCMSITAEYDIPDVTTQPLTTKPVSTKALTSENLSTRSLTTRRLTTSPLTTQPLTTGVTTKPVSTGGITTDAITTYEMTTMELTTQPLVVKEIEPPYSLSRDKSNMGMIIGGPVFVVLFAVFIFGLVLCKTRPVSASAPSKNSGKRNHMFSLWSAKEPIAVSDAALQMLSHTEEHDDIIVTIVFCALKGVGIACDPNEEHRTEMEDEHIVVDKFGGMQNQAYLGVYDGHGGIKTVDYVKAHLHENFLWILTSLKGDAVEAFKKAYSMTDDGLKDTSGCTAVSAFLTEKDGKRVLYTANVGDARIVLKRGNKAIRLTQDHKASDAEEQKRIEKKGGMILQDKVAGTLAVSRAFGDNELKQWVKAEPYIKVTPLTAEDTHIILACDGVWDVMSDQDAINLIQPEQTAQVIARNIMRSALEKGTTDNVSVVVAELPPYTLTTD